MDLTDNTKWWFLAIALLVLIAILCMILLFKRCSSFADHKLKYEKSYRAYLKAIGDVRQSSFDIKELENKYSEAWKKQGDVDIVDAALPTIVSTTCEGTPPPKSTPVDGTSHNEIHKKHIDTIHELDKLVAARKKHAQLLNNLSTIEEDLSNKHYKMIHARHQTVFGKGVPAPVRKGILKEA